MFQEYTIDDIPDEILAIILSEMTLEDRVQCKSVCRRWRWIVDRLNVRSLLVTSNRARSFEHNRLCGRHQFVIKSLIVNPLIENMKLIVQDNQLTRIRALKVDLDSPIELNAFKWSSVLRLLERSSLLEHLELRILTTQNYHQLATLTDHLITYNSHLKHLSLKKIRYMDFLYINNSELFGQSFARLANLTAFECDLCILNETSLEITLPSFKKNKLRKLYLPNANSISLLDDHYELRSLGLGLVDEILLNQLLDSSKYKYLSRLEIKIRGELIGEFISNHTIKVLTIHSLGIREKVNCIVNACRSIEVLSIVNCLLTNDTVRILIDNNSNTLQSIGLQNDYWDDDRQVDYLISSCFEKCSKLCTGYFKNVKLKHFYRTIYWLAIKNPKLVYKLYLDYLPSDDEFANSNGALHSSTLPVNLYLMNLEKDYNF